MRIRGIGAIALVVAAATTTGCTSSNGAPVVTTLFDEMTVVDGSGLLGPVIHYPGSDDEKYAHEAYVDVLGDPADVWMAYQEQLAQTYDLDAPTGLEACSINSSDRASCSLEGSAPTGDGALSVRLRMWQPRQDFAGRYVIKIKVVPYGYDDSPKDLGTLTPSNDDTDPIDEIPPPRELNATPPVTGAQIGNGTLNDAYSLPLPEGASVIRNLESGMGVDGISAYLKLDADVDAVTLAEEVADQLCEAQPPVEWDYDDLAVTFVECEGYAGDNPGSFYVIETPEHGTYFFFSVYID